ncbi:MAG: flagellar hook protein FlgE [Acidobacteriota bacterium]|jgi:flagellar hook protein FlgE|nr:flagellar hook protein FlgE [Acidobacteriota bacterium]
MPLTSFYTALTGLNSSSKAINVIGDNLANMNTYGFKAGKASFSELIGTMSGVSPSGNPVVFGMGSTLNGVNHNLTQGTINSTGTSTDASIVGNGYFVVSTGDGLGYTRSGKFQYDETGNLLSSDGYKLMGYMASGGKVDYSAGVVPIEIRMGQLIPANATTEMSIAVNLDAQAAIGDSFSAPVEVYDSLGAKHAVTVAFTQAGPDTTTTPPTLTWTWEATIPGEDITGGAAGTPEIIGSGTLTFDENGVLLTPATNPDLTITGLVDGAADMTVKFKMWDDAGAPVVTDAAKASGTSQTTQDGYAASILTDISFNSEGVISGLTEGGKSVNLAQLSMAVFPNYEGMKKYNGSTMTAFASAGEPSIGTPGSGGRGSIKGEALEYSNVDMAEEFVNLIISQRSYQANTRVITTSDELYQEAINLKR